MPQFFSEVAHELSQDQAKEKLKSFSDQFRADYADQLSDMEESWDDEGNMLFAFKVMGLKIDGRMEVSDSHAKVHGNLPFAAVVFKGQIEKQVQEQLLKALEA